MTGFDYTQKLEKKQAFFKISNVISYITTARAQEFLVRVSLFHVFYSFPISSLSVQKVQLLT